MSQPHVYLDINASTLTHVTGTSGPYQLAATITCKLSKKVNEQCSATLIYQGNTDTIVFGPNVDAVDQPITLKDTDDGTTSLKIEPLDKCTRPGGLSRHKHEIKGLVFQAPSVSFSRLSKDLLIPGKNGVYQVSEASIHCKQNYKSDEEIKLKVTGSAIEAETSLSIPAGTVEADITFALEKNGNIQLQRDESGAECRISADNSAYDIQVEKPIVSFDGEFQAKAIPGNNGVYQLGEYPLKVKLSYAIAQDIQCTITSDAFDPSPKNVTIPANETTASININLTDSAGESKSVGIEKADAGDEYFELSSTNATFDVQSQQPTLSLAGEVKNVDIAANKLNELKIAIQADYLSELAGTLQFTLTSPFLAGGETQLDWPWDPNSPLEKVVDLKPIKNDPDADLTSEDKHFAVTLETVTGCLVDDAKAEQQIALEVDFAPRLSIQSIKANKAGLHASTESTSPVNIQKASVIDLDLQGSEDEFTSGRIAYIEDKNESNSFMVAEVQQPDQWLIDFSVGGANESDGASSFNKWNLRIFEKTGDEKRSSSRIEVKRRVGRALKEMSIELVNADGWDEVQAGGSDYWIRFTADGDTKYFVEGELKQRQGDTFTIKVDRKSTGADAYKTIDNWKVIAFRRLHETVNASSEGITTGSSALPLQLKQAASAVAVGTNVYVRATKPGKNNAGVFIEGKLKATKRRQFKVSFKHGKDEEKSDWKIDLFNDSGAEYSGSDSAFFCNDQIKITVQRSGESDQAEAFRLDAYFNGKKIKTWTSDDYKIPANQSERSLKLCLDAEQFQQLKTTGKLEFHIVSTGGNCDQAESYHEDRLTAEEISARTLSIHPYPKALFDNSKPIKDIRKKVIEDESKPDEKYHYTVVGEKQTLNIRLPEAIPQQIVCFRIKDDSSVLRKRIIKGQDELAVVFLPTDGVSKEWAVNLAANRGNTDPVPKKIKLSTRAFANPLCDQYYELARKFRLDNYRDFLRVKFSASPKAALFFGEDSFSHTDDCTQHRERWVAVGDQVWFKLYRDGDTLDEVTIGDGIRLSSGAFEYRYPVTFDQDQRESKRVRQNSLGPEQGIKIQREGRHIVEVTLKRNTNASNGYQVVKERPRESDLVGYRTKTKWFRKRKFKQKILLHVVEKRLAYFPMDTVKAIRSAKPGDSVLVTVRLNIPADIHGEVTVSAPDTFVEDRQITFGFGQYLAQFEAELKPLGDFQRLSVELINPKGRIQLSDKTGGDYPSRINRIQACLDENEPIINADVDQNSGIVSVTNPMGRLKIAFSAAVPLPQRMDSSLQDIPRKFTISSPQLFKPAEGDVDPSGDPFPDTFFKLGREENKTHYEISVQHVKHEVVAQDSVHCAEVISLWKGKAVYQVQAIVDAPPESAEKDQLYVINDKYRICTDDTTDAITFEDIRSVVKEDLCLVHDTGVFTEKAGEQWTELEVPVDYGTFIAIEQDEPGGASKAVILEWPSKNEICEVEATDHYYLTSEDRFKKWVSNNWVDANTNSPTENQLICAEKGRRYYQKNEGIWKEYRAMQEEDICVIDGKYQSWDGAAWQDQGTVTDQDIILDVFQGVDKRFQFANSQWQEMADIKNHIEVPVSFVSTPGDRGVIVLSAENDSGIECTTTIGVGTKQLTVDLLNEKPLVLFRKDINQEEGDYRWIEPPQTVFAIGDQARVFVGFSGDVACGGGGEPMTLDAIVEKVDDLPTKSFFKKHFVVEEETKHYTTHSRGRTAGDSVTEGQLVKVKSRGRKGAYQFINGKWYSVSNVQVKAPFIKTIDEDIKEQATVVLGDVDQPAESLARVGYADIEFTGQISTILRKEKRYTYNKGVLKLTSDDACQVKAISKAVSVYSERTVAVLKGSVPSTSTLLEGDKLEFTLQLSIPAPRNSAKLKVKGGYYKLNPVTTEGYVQCHGDNSVSIPAGQLTAKVSLEITETSADVDLELEAIEGGCCKPDRRYVPELHIGVSKPKEIIVSEPYPQGKKGEAINLLVQLEHAAPPDCEAIIEAVGDFFDDKTIPVPQDMDFFYVSLPLTENINTTPGSEVNVTLQRIGDASQQEEKRGVLRFHPSTLSLNATIDGQKKGEGFLETAIDCGEVPAGTSINVELKNGTSETQKCVIRSNAFGGQAYTAKIPANEVEEMEVVVTTVGRHDIHVCSLDNPKIKVDSRESFTVTVKARDPSVMPCPHRQDQALQAMRVSTQLVPRDELETQCNLHSMKITVKRGGEVVSRRGSDGSFYVARNKALVEDKTKKPLIYTQDKVPILQVLAGRERDMVKPDEDNQKIHLTTLEIDLNQPEGYEFCPQHYHVPEVSRPLHHPFLAIEERFQGKPGEARKKARLKPFEEACKEAIKEAKRKVSGKAGTRAIREAKENVKKAKKKVKEKEKEEENREKSGKLFLLEDEISGAKTLDICTDATHQSQNTAITKRARRETQWYPFTPDVTREMHRKLPPLEPPNNGLGIVEVKLDRHEQKWLKSWGVEQLRVQAQSCGVPGTSSPGSEAGPTSKLDLIVEVYPTTEKALKLGGGPDSNLMSIGHRGKFFDPEQGFDPNKGFDKGLKKGLRSVKKAQTSVPPENPSAAPTPPPYDYDHFTGERQRMAGVDSDANDPMLAMPLSDDMRQHLSFYNAITLDDGDSGNKLVDEEDSDYLFYPIDDYIASKLKRQLTPKFVTDIYNGCDWLLNKTVDIDDYLTLGTADIGVDGMSLQSFSQHDDTVNHGFDSNPYEDFGSHAVGATDRQSGSFNQLDNDIKSAADDYVRDWQAMAGAKVVEDGEDAQGNPIFRTLNEAEQAEKWLGIAGSVLPLGMLSEIRFGKNGQLNVASEILEKLFHLVQTLVKLAQFVFSILNNAEFKWGWGFGVNFSVNLFNGQILHYKGWKECDSHQVFKWQYWSVNCNLIDIEAEGNFGIGFSVRGVGASAMIYLAVGIDGTVKGVGETVPPDKTKTKNALKDLQIDITPRIEAGLKAVIVHEGVCCLKGCGKFALKFRIAIAPLTQFQIYNDGLSIEVEIRLIGITKTTVFWILKPDTDKLPFGGTGLWSPNKSPEDSPKTRAAIQHLYTLADAIIIKIQRQLAGYLRMYQTLQLNMYMVGGRPPRTDILPGHRPKKPDECWQNNFNKWEKQWLEVTSAFDQETRKIPGRNVLWTHKVGDRLKNRVKKLDTFTEAAAEQLRILDKIRADYTTHANAYAEVFESEEKQDTTVLARHAREADELIKRANKVRKTRLSLGDVRSQRHQYHLFQEYLKDLHYYGLRRREW